MSMKAQIRRDACGNTTIYMEGRLSYENSLLFKRELEEIVKKNPADTIVVDMYKLEFVGSSGIGFFVKTLKTLIERTNQIKLHNVKNEFLRFFRSHGLNVVDEGRVFRHTRRQFRMGS